MQNSQSEKKVARWEMLSNQELAAFCAEIAMILKSGIPVTEGLSIMSEDVKDSAGRQILQELYAQVDIGEPVWRALESSGRFPKYMVDMTRIGETTGRLDDVMESLSSYYEREEAVARSVRSAVTYPLVMVAMMVVVIAVLIVEVLPIFQEVFIGLGSEMSGISRSLLDFGALLARYSFVLLGVAAALILGYAVLRFTVWGRGLMERWKSTFFATRKLYAKIASGRFASALSLMLSSGLDTDQSLDMVYNLVDNEYIRRKIDNCRSRIAEGASFSDALLSADIFTGVYAKMVMVGFRTGSSDTVMQRIAERYEEEIDTQISGIISMLEPTLVAVLSVVVGMVLLSVMMPLMGIMSSIG